MHEAYTNTRHGFCPKPLRHTVPICSLIPQPTSHGPPAHLRLTPTHAHTHTVTLEATLSCAVYHNTGRVPHSYWPPPTRHTFGSVTPYGRPTHSRTRISTHTPAAAYTTLRTHTHTHTHAHRYFGGDIELRSVPQYGTSATLLLATSKASYILHEAQKGAQSGFVSHVAEEDLSLDNGSDADDRSPSRR